MKKGEDYREAGDECRMAKLSHTSAERDILLNIALTWDALAISKAAESARERRIRALEMRGAIADGGD